MPSKNTVKFYDCPAYYHVYNRGAGGSPLFFDDYDRLKFLSILERHLNQDDTSIRSDGYVHEKYDTELIAYCLMKNHFHLLLYQETDTQAISNLMHSVSTAYTMYFNKKYKQYGHLFQSVFKASRISDEAYLLHITRYIHMNPRNYLRYKWSSLGLYLDLTMEPSWVNGRRVNDLSARQYREFIDSYAGKKIELEQIKHQLAE